MLVALVIEIYRKVIVTALENHLKACGFEVNLTKFVYI
jgi:hypothetical protein